MTPVLAPRRRRARRIAPRAVLGVVAVVALCLLVLAVLVPAFERPAFIGRLTVENPHRWAVNVDVDDPSRDGWIGIGTAERESSRVFRQVFDRGDRWVFRFTYAGIDGGELEVAREDLERADWSITVPDEFARRLRAAGVSPSGR